MKPLNLNSSGIEFWKTINFLREKWRAHRSETKEYNNCRKLIRKAACHGHKGANIFVTFETYYEKNSVIKQLEAQGCRVQKDDNNNSWRSWHYCTSRIYGITITWEEK